MAFARIAEFPDFQAEYEGSIPFTRSNDLGCRLPGRERIVDMVTLRINDRFGWGAARLNQHGELVGWHEPFVPLRRKVLDLVEIQDRRFTLADDCCPLAFLG